FQAEDGIRDFHVTGVQTCALPISFWPDGWLARNDWTKLWPICRRPTGQRSTITACWTKRGRADRTKGLPWQRSPGSKPGCIAIRSEERRVGKEERCRRAPAPCGDR